MLFNQSAGEFVKAIAHDNHLYGIPDSLRASKTMPITNLIFELLKNSFDNVTSSRKLRMLKPCSDEVDL